MPRLSFAAVSLFLWLAACGGGDDDDDTSPDGAQQEVDASISDGGPQPGCDFTEADDGGNAEVAEVTGLAPGATRITICGSIAANKPAVDGLVDLDRYEFDAPANGGYVVRLVAAGGGALAVLGSGVSAGDIGYGRGLFVGDHLVYATQLASGAYVVDVFALHTGTPELEVGYRLEIVGEDLDERCVRLAGGAAYTEAADGAGNTGNDVIEVRWATDPSRALTESTGDAPEPTGVVVSAAMSYKLAGSLGVSNVADEYGDRDTYAILTGGQANQLDVRVTWAGNAADLDVLLFDEVVGATPFDLAAAASVSNTSPELLTTAVLPSTTYWLWIGAYDGSTGQPIAYEATVCASNWAP